MDNNKQNEDNQNRDNQNREQDRHLQSPGEANRDKHINFTALEQGDRDPADDRPDESSKIYLTDDSSLQTAEEKEGDNMVDPRKDRSISVSEDDLHDAKAGRLTGRESQDERATRAEDE